LRSRSHRAYFAGRCSSDRTVYVGAAAGCGEEAPDPEERTGEGGARRRARQCDTELDCGRRRVTFQHADTAEQAERNVEHKTVRDALEALPPAQRRTIELAYFGGYTHVELSELMGVPLGTVKGRMRIGLQKMRRALEHTR